MTGESFKHFVRYLAGVEPAQTQTTQAEREALRTFATGRRRLVEIGVFEGFNTRLLADVMSVEGTLFAVDPFFTGRIGVCWGKWIARRQVADVRRRKNVKFIEELSYNAAQQLPGTFDFIFIDGDHSLEGIRRDWNDWSARVEAGGIIALHDSIALGHNPAIANLGSCQFYHSNIKSDRRFEVAQEVESLAILRRNH